ncbi:uncharacterized protein BO95DRAFT_81680 [Aspergillus brunneoviolaceus CBS 621.78]|uniref:Uncharacterized protein n=1 Tax=Aspergillus brunneoviolaceus CBS 621.78 TaxID=1450534 RepID=A0ACD1GE93_9EURO|nr:hypothetical protein BO95DRAFT_81680 [Aspergillus brunneoviolaceus CBS 621.78]RAH47625.1 hypothetical protein BO95DRAFT_81680 [Aspergillus brunneoviolaceus CBS 621.78]
MYLYPSMYSTAYKRGTRFIRGELKSRRVFGFCVWLMGYGSLSYCFWRIFPLQFFLFSRFEVGFFGGS